MKDYILTLISSIRINDVLDILITAFVIYKILGFIKQTRAQQLVKGLLIIVAAYFASALLDLNTINWLLKGLFTFGLFAVVVIFQPELRRGLEFMGRSKFSVGSISQLDSEKAKHIVDEISSAAGEFSQSRTGALIVFEREIALDDVMESGTQLNAEISAQLLGNIFYEGAPLHDGAVIIRGDRIYAAGCVLPLTENKNLNKSLGTRHRAGIGISERSDALVLIVSEETGIISVAEDGRLRRFLDEKDVEKILLGMYLTGKDEDHSFKFSRLLERLKKGSDHNHAE
ncbi:MAG: diadenylate cyclase CdaA [Eubacterium sp.]|jgi:diadenylate cyclase|nr:diadenylate cyclase CdaA [Eubacterium sp.]MCH4046503.1 diadenylate cyclase CdaA [Eubacterium sp.]MCH4079598.1 diadenylate cyclase CdaA [Eubacterium sp.]MCH4110157.1 diadenylate cyclase CdaA [Eubacterium sp.]MCI1307419.1 diadenylate cyclase CdaA [Eubacterium sp.]